MACLASQVKNLQRAQSTWEDYLQSLERRFRKEPRRSWRVFTKANGATFRVIGSHDERRVFAALESQQRARLPCGDEVVATLLGLVDRSRFVMVRISTHLTK
jgi:hypothetical protein